MGSPTLQGRRITRVLMKLAIAVLLALLFGVLGTVSGLGYHRNLIEERDFVVHTQLGYADASISFSATYDPLLFPFYWIKGTGYIKGNYSLILLPSSLGPSEFSTGIYGLGPSDRYGDYTMQMLLWGFWANLIILLFFTVTIEAARARVLYLAFILGLLGFFVATIVGMLVGLAIGVAVILFITIRLPKDNMLSRFWYSLWE